MTVDPERCTMLFALAGQADADNISPAIWSVARDGSPVLVYVADAAVRRELATAWWLRECPNVNIVSVAPLGPHGGVRERIGRLRWNRWRLKRALEQSNVRLVIMEWKEGIAHHHASWLRSLVRWWSADVFMQLQFVAADMGIPTVSLPHGHSTKTSIIRSEHIRSEMAKHSGKLAFADRDSHAAYVFASEYHRKVIVNNSTMSGTNTYVWGSARFNDVWVQRLYDATPTTELPPMVGGQIRRVLLFVPKWHNLVDRVETMKLIGALGNQPELQLVVRGHLRARDTSFSESESALLHRSNVVMVPEGISSPSLIRGCDVVVDVDSSIAFDAVLLNKPYVRPRYLQDASVRTIWDELGGAHQTDSCEATVALLTQTTLQPAHRDATFDDVVFGGSGEIVLNRYRDELRALANR
ncbi:MAG: hypothetical protein ACO3US_06120 [Ilumatobacteraceae bacterium]